MLSASLTGCKDKQKIWKLKSFFGLLTSIQFLSTMRFTINVFSERRDAKGQSFLFFLNTDSTKGTEFAPCGAWTDNNYQSYQSLSNKILTDGKRLRRLVIIVSKKATCCLSLSIPFILWFSCSKNHGIMKWKKDDIRFEYRPFYILSFLLLSLFFIRKLISFAVPLSTLP